MDLTIVIVSWNTVSFIADCLRSIPAAAGGLNYRIIVVDNASADGSPVRIAREFPEVRLIRNPENVGYARGNNQGIREPESHASRHILLLNSDTLLNPGSLSPLVHFLDEHPDAGAVGPRLIQIDGTPQPYAFGRDPTLSYLLARLLCRTLFRRPMHNWATDTVQKIDWVSGACLMVRRQSIDEVGLLDEHFFIYFEDNDWCLRMRQKGWQIYHNPQVSVHHHGGKSLLQNPAAREAYHQSLIYFNKKHYGKLADVLLRICLRISRWGPKNEPIHCS